MGEAARRRTIGVGTATGGLLAIDEDPHVYRVQEID